MKRAHDKAARGSDANGPWAKRMATDASAGATSRFGFGFRGSISSKSSTTVSDANGGRTTNQAETTAETLVVKEERPESANNNEPSEERNAHEGLRGRGKLTYREKAASRPNVRKSTASALPARSNSRLVLKQHETGNSVPRGLAEPLVALPTDGRSKLVKPSLDLLRSDEKENDEPSNSSGLRVIETFDNVLTTLVSADRLDQMEALLQVRLKAKKFDMKSRLEESQNHNRQLKGGLRTSLDNERSITAEWSNAKQHLLVEISALEAKSKRFSALTAEKDLQITRLSQEIDGIREENHLADTRVRELTQQMNNLLDEHKQASRVRSELEASNQRLQAQLQLAQKANDEMGLELRAYKTTMSDRVQLYEEKKKELEQFYHRKDCEEEKRKTFEIERLQGRVNELKEEIGVANQEKESYRQRAFAAEEEVKKTRDMCAQIEREKCKIEAQYQSQDERLQQYTAEVAQMKAKLDQKDHEISGLVQSLTEIQKLTAASSSKVDSEKQALSEKIEQLQSQLREAERNEATIAAQLREQRTQLDGFTDSKNEWTTKCRDLEGQVKELEGEVLRITRDLSVETGVRQMLESQNRELRTENMAANAQMEAVRLDVKRLTSMHEEAKISWQSTLHDAEKRLEKEKESLLRQIEVLQEEKVSVESEVKTLRERVANVRDADFEELCDVKREAEVLRLRLNEMSSHGSQSIAQKDRLIEELQEKLRQGEKQRRSLHNTIQELRGNVRVFARTRPFLPSDGSSDSLTPAVSCEFDGQTMRLRRQGKGTSGADPEAFSFTFDKVFSPSVGQDSVFDEVSEFVQSAIDGYHVCLFSYGQTGSGKTHTMQGSGNGQMRGIIPRSIEKVLTECAHLREHGWAYTMKASFLEIYNETLKDLLATKEDANKSLVIKRDAKGGVHVPELTLVDVVSTDQVDQLMERANRARSVACTDMNAQSSRSHSVFTLHLQGVNDSEGIMLDGQLNLVDLAGSERASRSGVSGERLKETRAINKSLSCLADVFTAIGNKAPHIPFRNSKLTYLLQSSLSGDGKTLMMVNVSPTMESAGETLCSLRFAQQVNKCELGKPKRQIKSKKDT